MATSSITKNFIISGSKQVKAFLDAIESSKNDCPDTDDKIFVTEIKGEENLRKFMAARKNINSK